MPKIGFIGDVYPGAGDRIRIGADVAERLADLDLLVANLEGPVTRRTSDAADKGVHLRTDPRRVDLLRELQIDVAVLANNHMFDFGVGGFEDTKRSLDAVGIDYVGAGRDLAPATRPFIGQLGDLSIGLIAYSAREIETVCAEVDGPGCAPLDIDLVQAGLEALRLEVDVTILFLHWGLMGYELPTPAQVRLAEQLAELGPTLVIGCHPHVVQGIIGRDEGLVAYSLGDFAFHPITADGRAVDQHRVRQTGMLLTVEVDEQGVRGFEATLTRQRGAAVSLEASTSRARGVDRATARVAGPERDYGRTWRRYVLRRTGRRVLRRAAPWRWRSLTRGAFRGLKVALKELARR